MSENTQTPPANELVELGKVLSATTQKDSLRLLSIGERCIQMARIQLQKPKGGVMKNKPEQLTNMEALRGAVARGWCHPANEKKEMDTDLAGAITEEVAKFIQKQLVDA